MITNRILELTSGTLAVALIAITLGSGARAQQSSPADEKSEEARTGAISGRVVNENGQPLANAAVYVRPFGSARQSRTTTTDGEGSIQLSGLDRGVYMVFASVPAYTTAPRDPDSTQATYYRLGDSVKLELIKGGVITGTVTTAAGEPVVAVRVRAFMIRDGSGQPLRFGSPFRERTTDDRGSYRIYGLSAGTYVVSAGGDYFLGSTVNGYDNDVPTYAPSSTRDTAMEINVRAGEEAANIDVRYRGERGHVVSGMVSAPGPASANGVTILLSSSVNGASQSSTSYQPPGSSGFAFHGVADGDYYVTAQAASPEGEWVVSERRRIKVRGADVLGIELNAKPLGSISGRLVLEESKTHECKGKRRPLFAETIVTPWHNEKGVDKDQPPSLWSLGGPILPDKQGDFTLRNLVPGQYRFNIRSFAKYWYLQSISLPPAVAPKAVARPVDAARNWTTLKPGERFAGLTITLAEGAASLHGQIKLAESQKLPSRLFVYLVPAESEKAEEVLRFFASPVAADGTFALNNLPPGRYWASAKPALENESNILSKLRLPDEVEARAKLRREAETAKREIEFRFCENKIDYQLPLSLPTASPQ